MVWAFVTGMVMGFPVGCYMREQGYSTKLKNAMNALSPTDYSTDNFEKVTNSKKRERYYRDLQSGMAKPEDFERYVYGAQANKKFGQDAQDKMDEKATEQIRKWEEETRDQIIRSVGNPGQK